MIGGTKHIAGGSYPKLLQIFFGRHLLLLHKDPVQVSTVNSDEGCDLRDVDIVAVVIFHIFSCHFQINLSKVLLIFDRMRTHCS